MTIGIIGGTGGFGRGLAERLRRAGEEVLVGSRSPREDIVSNEEAARRADLVVLSVPPEGVEATAAELADALEGKIVLSVAAPVVFRDGRPTADPAGRSLAETTAAAAPGARVIAGFHTVAARALKKDTRLDEDILLAGDDAAAKAVVAALAERLVDGRAVDCGALESARWLETLTALILNVNRTYKTEAGIRVTGI